MPAIACAIWIVDEWWTDRVELGRPADEMMGATCGMIFILFGLWPYEGLVDGVFEGYCLIWSWHECNESLRAAPEVLWPRTMREDAPGEISAASKKCRAMSARRSFLPPDFGMAWDGCCIESLGAHIKGRKQTEFRSVTQSVFACGC